MDARTESRNRTHDGWRRPWNAVRAAATARPGPFALQESHRTCARGTPPDLVTPFKNAAVRAQGAFTLVELLVVIGIIAVLLAILLPSLNRAREKARMVQCASNLRQLGTAAVMYANENKGVFPGIADQPRPDDWIHWRGSPPNNDLQNSALAPHLGKPVSPAVFRCPSDPWETHTPRGGFHPYPYFNSYSMNCFIGTGPFAKGLRMTQVRNSAEKILFLEEDERTINDGLWLPPLTGGYIDYVSDRHEIRRRVNDLKGRGNCAFVDGHVDFVARSYAHDPAHYLPER